MYKLKIFLFNRNLLIFLSVIASSLFHYYIFSGSNMNVIDEMQYIQGILKGPSASAYPSPLFFKIYEFLTVKTNIVLSSRLLNLLILLLGAFPIYKIAKRYLDEISTFTILIFYLFSPFSFYITNVMPEIIFGVFFYYILYFVEYKMAKVDKKNLLYLAIFINLLALIKNHAVFLLPVIIFWVLLDGKTYIEKVKNSFFFLIAFFILKFLTDNFIYGEFHIFGRIYGDIYQTKLIFNWKMFANFFTSFLGNILFVFPFLVLIFATLIKHFKLGLKFILRDRFNILTLFSLFCFMTITAFFSSLVVDSPGESIYRIHERYYSYLLVLFFIFTIRNVSNFRFSRIESLIIISILTSTIFISKKIITTYYELSYIDNPDFNSFYGMRFLPILILLCAIISKLDLKKYMLLLIYTMTFASLIIAPRGYLARSIDTPSDFAGKYVCKSNLNDRIKNVYVENIVSYGFFYYNCPGDYNLKFFENEKFTLKRNSIYIKNFSDGEIKYLLNLQKINDSIYIY